MVCADSLSWHIFFFVLCKHIFFSETYLFYLIVNKLGPILQNTLWPQSVLMVTLNIKSIYINIGARAVSREFLLTWRSFLLSLSYVEHGLCSPNPTRSWLSKFCSLQFWATLWRFRNWDTHLKIPHNTFCLHFSACTFLRNSVPSRAQKKTLHELRLL